jgi:hypothetical protein
LYPTKDAVSTTLTSYLTSTVANNTYAPLLNPSFNGTLAVNSANFGQLRALPTGNGGESSIACYRNPAQAGDNVAGGVWSLGHNTWGCGQGNFAIGTVNVGRCLSISSTGVLNVHQPAIFNSNVTSSGVITGTASNGNTGWASWQVLAAPGGSSAAYVRAIGAINDTEVGYSWANATDTALEYLNRWSCLMTPGNNNLEWHGALLGRCIWLSSANGSLNVDKPAVFNSSITFGGNNLQDRLNTLASKPWVAGRCPGVAENGVVAPFARNGLQLFTCTRTGVGSYLVSWTTPHPSGIEYSVHLTTSMVGYGTYSNVTPTSVKFDFFSIGNVVYRVMNPTSTLDLGEDPFQFSFLTVPEGRWAMPTSP